MPVARVELMQVVRVKAIPEGCGPAERLEGARFPEAPRDRAVAIDLLPRVLVSGGELLHAHLPRREDDVLAVVQLPVAREDAVFLREARVQRSPGERRDDGEAGEVDAGVDREVGGDVEDLARVVVEA